MNSEVLPCGEGFSGDVELRKTLKGCRVEKGLWAVAQARILRGCCVAKDLWVCHRNRCFRESGLVTIQEKRSVLTQSNAKLEGGRIQKM